MIEIIDVATSPAVIKVLGVGGGGSNAVARMIQAGLGGVEFWVANTDLQALENSGCANRLQIGRTTTRGLGAGGDPDVGRRSAEEDRDAIAAAISGADMLFITAGMGGGTGTGAAPVVAEIAQQLGILTVAIVTRPFHFEGKKKMTRAQGGIELLGSRVDTLIPIPNQKLLNIVTPGTPFAAAMLVADEVLFQATRGISDLITGHGMINLDFADVKSVMASRGNALLGCGVGTGPNRALEAAQSAVSSPLLEEVSILGAEALLINVQGGPDMGLHEAAEATQFIADRVGDEADVFWGAVLDPSLSDEMRVTIIATGFTQTAPATVTAPEPAVQAARPAPEIPRPPAEPIPGGVRSTPPFPAPVAAAPRVEPRPAPPPAEPPVAPLRPEPIPAASRLDPLSAPFRSDPLSVPLRPDPLSVSARLDEEPGYGPISSDRWGREPAPESEIFLPAEDPLEARAGAAFDWRAGEQGGRALGDEESARDVEPARRSDRWWDLDRLVPSSRRSQGHRIGTRPLDKPAFMRKPVDD